MAASFPTSIKSFTTKLDGAGKIVYAAYINDPQDEIVAIEGALITGFTINPKPSVAGAADLGTSSLPWGNAHLRGLDFDAAVQLTIASGAVTVTQTYHTIDTEGDAATDDLDTLTATGVTEGFVAILRAENVARVVTVKDGTGNLVLSSDLKMDATDKTLTLVYDGTNWRELARSGGTVTRVIDHVTTAVEVVSTASETAIYTKSIVGGLLGTNRGLRLRVFGDYLQNNTSTMRIQMKYGSTVIFDTGAISFGNSANRGSMELRVTLMGRGATNAQLAAGECLLGPVSAASNAGVASIVRVHYSSTHVSCAEDSTGALNLIVTVTHGASSANQSCKMYGALLEMIE